MNCKNVPWISSEGLAEQLYLNTLMCKVGTTCKFWTSTDLQPSLCLFRDGHKSFNSQSQECSGEQCQADIQFLAKSLQSCPTLCDPIDSSPPGSPVPGILQARTLEWVAVSFSNAWKWKKWKWSHSAMSNPQRPHGLQPSRLLHPWDFPGRSTGVGCHCLLLTVS